MRHLRPARLIRSFLLLGALLGTSAVNADVVLLGSVAIPGTATDKSGLMELLSDGTPHNRLGALGSGIAYTGKGNRYILLPDRGPVDGQANYHCRVQLMDISVTLGGNPVLQSNLIATTLLKTEAGQQLVERSISPEVGVVDVGCGAHEMIVYRSGGDAVCRERAQYRLQLAGEHRKITGRHGARR